MLLFKTFFKIAYRRIMITIVYMSVFVMLILMFTNTAKDSFESNFQAEELNLIVEDLDQTVASKGFITYLETMHHVTTEKIDSQSLADKIYYRKVQYAIRIPKGFEKNLKNSNTEGILINMKIPGSNSSYYADEQINQFLQCMGIYLSNGMQVEEALQHTLEGFAKTPKVEEVYFHDRESGINEKVFYFYQYMSYILILLAVTGLTPILNILNEKNVKSRMICSSYHYKKQIVSIICSCALYSVLLFLLFEVIGFIMYKTDIFMKEARLCALNSIVFLLFSIGLAILLSYLSLDENILNMIANMGALAMAFITGSFVPQSMLSEKVLRVGQFLPGYWYIKNNNMLAGFGKEILDMQTYWRNLGIECLFVVAVFAAVLVLIKKKSLKL